MPDPIPATQTIPAAFTLEQVQALITKGITDATAPLQAEIATLKKAATPAPATVTPPPATATDAAKPLTLADLEKVLQTRDQSASVLAARSAYADAKCKDLPSAYRNQLPNTADAAELARAEATIRQAWAADLAAAGFKPANVAGTPPANGQAATRVPVDTSKMTGSELISAGVQQRGAPATATAADVAAAKTA